MARFRYFYPEARLVKKRMIPLITGLAFCTAAAGQQPYVHIIHPGRPVIQTAQSRNYLSGNTCKGCRLTMNGTAVKVYPTGSFAVQVDLEPGDTLLQFTSTSPGGTTASQKVTYHFRVPVPPAAVQDFRMAKVETLPEGNCWLMPGEEIRFRVTAQPGNKITVNQTIPLYELPASQTGGVPGVYQGTYRVRAQDPNLKKPFLVRMTGHGHEQTYSVSPAYRVLGPDEIVVGETVGALPYLEFGLGTDRLGGAKISYLDTAVRLQVTGKFAGQYRVQLSKGRSAYIPVGNVLLLPKGTFSPRSLTGSWRVWGDDRYDYVSIGLAEKLPYTTFQQIDPSRIVMDIYGATSNSNWITQLQSAREIKNVWYRQIEDGVFRVTIALRHHQHWGYEVYYTGNALTVRVKRQPANLSLSHLTIAVDPGHGGTNRGALGPANIYEKQITLEIAKKLEALLKQQGATVIMTRTTDASKDMIQRTSLLRMADPDLLVSVHLNSAADPIHVSGTSTYYRYIGFRPLSVAILRHMLGLGLQEYGNVGRFNFSLNGPTEYPNALVETLFLSNPEDEMKALDPGFQQQIAQAIVAGIRDFLKQAGDTPAQH
jgi:N-acetylmuramoyl-L-alanine amidase